MCVSVFAIFAIFAGEAALKTNFRYFMGSSLNIYINV